MENFTNLHSADVVTTHLTVILQKLGMFFHNLKIRDRHVAQDKASAECIHDSSIWAPCIHPCCWLKMVIVGFHSGTTGPVKAIALMNVACHATGLPCYIVSQALYFHHPISAQVFM